ncbi:MAG: peptidoglycan bridge formation glycyltransferase FemA/FemB family protein [Patescibacteria group bacterium]
MVNIRQIQSKSQWEEFLNNTAPHTFLQSWEWGLCQEALGNKIFRLGVFENNNLCEIAFVYKIKARRGSFLFCPHLFNYQLSIIYPVKSCKAGAKQFNRVKTISNFQFPISKQIQIFQLFLEEIKKIAKDEKVDFVRISPLMKKTQEAEKMFKKLKFRKAPMHMHPELAWMLDITPTEEELLKNMKKNTRYSIRKAQKDGVKIVASSNPDDVDAFYNIYQHTADRRNFKPFSKEYIKKEFSIFSQEQKILLFSAFYKNEIIATAMVIYMHGSGFYHHGASIKKYSNIPASELLQWHAIHEAKNRGMKLYNFWGISPETAKKHSWTGLTKFKKGFGGFSEEYLPAQDFILTSKYWLNYIIETGRRIKRGY